MLSSAHEDSFAIVQARISETAREAFATLVWSEGISGDATIDDSVVNAVFLAVADFLSNPAVSSIVEMHNMDPGWLGYNLILSGNRHGAGFWDTVWNNATVEQLQTLHNYSLAIEVYEGGDEREEVWYAI